MKGSTGKGELVWEKCGNIEAEQHRVAFASRSLRGLEMAATNEDGPALKELRRVPPGSRVFPSVSNFFQPLTATPAAQPIPNTEPATAPPALPRQISLDWGDETEDVTGLLLAAAQQHDALAAAQQPSLNRTNFVADGQVHQVYATNVPWDQHWQPAVKVAKLKEFENIKSFDAFEEVVEDELDEEEQRNKIRSTWVVVDKGLNNQQLLKARICARGDEEVVNVKTTSPTLSHTAERLLLHTAACKSWTIQSIDFTAAFLQGEKIDRKVIVIPPHDLLRRTERGQRVLWRLVKRLYGLKDSSRGFYLGLDTHLLANGMKRSQYDRALYMFFDENGQLAGLLGTHVDDIIFAGTEQFHNRVIVSIRAKYKIGSEEIRAFCFTGWNLTQTSAGIVLTQADYLSKVAAQDFEHLTCTGRDKEDKLSEKELSAFRGVTGILGWVAKVTKPDLARTYCQMSCKSTSATVEDARRAKRIVRKMLASPQQILFRNIGDPKDCSIYTAFDASYGKLNEVDSVVGSLVCLEGENNKSNVVSWRSTKLQLPAASPLAAEGEAALDAHGTTRLVRALMADMFGYLDQIDIVTKFPAKLVTDSKSLYDAVQSDNSLRDKRTGIAVSTLRRCEEFDNMQVCWVAGKDNPADILTKEGVAPELISSILAGNRELPEAGRLLAGARFKPCGLKQQLDWQQAPPDPQQTQLSD